MSSIIQVSYEEAEKKTLTDKLKDHIGIHKLEIFLENGHELNGLLSEVGKDYISVIEENRDLLIPMSRIVYFRYRGD